MRGTAVALRRAGLGPEHLAAAGLDAAGTTALVGRVEQCDAAVNGDLAAADAAYESAADSYADAVRAVREGDSTQRERDTLASAKTSLDAAAAARDGVLDDLFDAGVDTLSASTVAMLTQMRANAHHRVPVEFLVVARTAAEWRELKDLLTHVRVAEKQGEEPYADCVDTLDGLRADTDVAAAKVAYDAGIASVTSAWETACE